MSNTHNHSARQAFTDQEAESQRGGRLLLPCGFEVAELGLEHHGSGLFLLHSTSALTSLTGALL